MTGPEPFVLPDLASWRAWLDEHEDTSDGVWLLLAKRGTTAPTTIDYQEALLEALASGWIDGQRRGVDGTCFVQRFTPRRARSIWSQRNIGLVERLAAEGRLRPRGLAEVDAAQADGRWARAYAGPATIEVPPDLEAALAVSPAAGATFAGLNSQNRFAVLHRIVTAPNDATRARRLARLVDMLARGETPYPQPARSAAGPAAGAVGADRADG
ncbi:YdeI/OmpD-associated family protein [Cellulomonas alba]|uniref:YdeI/OmpD-associated family protein n=1 Tax=Cellulomonas alba TaxID=3053467 RepID=A0ABT7SHC5_9CELL|nr:YdeI/OmpD-associated family protein [Cellulomonas alba]MDM7854957.1 YdeI/OmpD-associated family protein [Cellulomonas alba]